MSRSPRPRGRSDRDWPRVFVSYRRDDAAGHAGRLYDALAERFGASNVFMDVDAIDLGVEFRGAIDGAIASCDVVLGVIGRGWATATDASGRRRLDDPDDFVRLELESAFARNIAVIPTLVQGADMPSSSQVPPSLSLLPGRQGIELRDTAWHDDVDRLVRRLERQAHDNLRGDHRSPQPGDQRRPRAATERVPRSYGRRTRRVLLPLLLALAALAATTLALVVLRSDDDAAMRRLASVVPRGVSCDQSDEAVAGAVTLACAAGSGLGVTYAQFETADELDDWYAAKVPADLAPGSGSCGVRPFRGEKPYVVDGKQAGRFVCFFDNQGEAQLVWKDERWTVGGEAAVHESGGTPGAGPGDEGARLLFGAWNRRMQLGG